MRSECHKKGVSSFLLFLDVAGNPGSLPPPPPPPGFDGRRRGGGGRVGLFLLHQKTRVQAVDR